MIQSVLDQSYQNWELCLANGDPAVQKDFDAYTAQDKRIKVKQLESNLGIGGNTNAAIGMAGGEFIAFLDQDDCLAPFALYETVSAINQYPETDLLFSDEDYLTADSKRRYNPVFKPVFSIDYLRAANYMLHFLVVRKELGDRLGWLRDGFEGAQDFDLILRAVEQAHWITHVPKVLYHWRALPTSTAATQDAKVYAHSAGVLAVEEHLKRCGLEADVKDGPYPGLVRVEYQVSSSPLISIIIPNYEHAEDLSNCIDLILSRSTYQNYEILIVENNSRSKEIFSLYEQLKKRDQRIRILEFSDTPFNFSEINNYSVGQSSGDVLLFLNNDTRIINPDWLDRMLEYALRPDVGAVGAKLYFPNKLLQHGGVIIGMGGCAGHHFVGTPMDDPGYRYNLIVPQNLSAVTGACLMMRRKVFDEVGGFDTDYQLAFGDIDLCLKVRQKGYLITWTPFAELIHHESLTRGYEDTRIKESRFFWEADLLKKRWPDIFATGDPYYNPNLMLKKGYFSVQAEICDQAPRVTKGLFPPKN